jgi:hypothetical protein
VNPCAPEGLVDPTPHPVVLILLQTRWYYWKKYDHRKPIIHLNNTDVWQQRRKYYEDGLEQGVDNTPLFKYGNSCLMKVSYLFLVRTRVLFYFSVFFLEWINHDARCLASMIIWLDSIRWRSGRHSALTCLHNIFFSAVTLPCCSDDTLVSSDQFHINNIGKTACIMIYPF